MAKNDAHLSLQKAYKAWQKVIDKVFHNFVNKLAILRAKNKDLNTALPSLIKAYHLAIEHKLMAPELEKNLLADIEEQANLKQETEPMFDLMDATCSLLDELHKLHDMRIVAGKTIHALLEQYPFSDQQRALIHFNPEGDFTLIYSELFFKAALQQLFDFTCKNFTATTLEKVEVFFSHDSTHSYVHFKLYAPDVKDNYEYFYNNSLSISPNNITPGLNVCRLAILRIGGDISYEAKSGKWVDFVMAYPIRPYVAI